MIDLTILMDNEVGRPARILADLANAGIDVAGGCLFPRLGGRVAHIAVLDKDVEAIRAVVARHMGTLADERTCLVVAADFPGGAAAVSGKVAEAGIMVNISYFGARGEMILGTTDTAGAARILGLD